MESHDENGGDKERNKKDSGQRDFNTDQFRNDYPDPITDSETLQSDTRPDPRVMISEHADELDADSLSGISGDSDDGRGFELLIAYPSTHSYDLTTPLLRPCKVVKRDHSFYQWCGIFMENDNQLYIRRYNKIPDVSLKFVTGDTRSKGIPIHGRFDKNGNLDFDILAQYDPIDFAPYVLMERSIQISGIYIYRLLVSDGLWPRVMAKLSPLIAHTRCNGDATMEMVSTLAACWRAKTTSFQGACTRFPNLVNAAASILTDGQLLMEVVQAVVELDEEDGVDHFCFNRGKIPIEEWLENCRDDTFVCVGAEQEGDDCLDGNWCFHWAFQEPLDSTNPPQHLTLPLSQALSITMSQKKTTTYFPQGASNDISQDSTLQLQQWLGKSLQDLAEVPNKEKKKRKRKKRNLPVEPSFDRPLMVYPESTAVDVIRPCLVKGQESYVQWFAFTRSTSGSLRVHAYERIDSGSVAASTEELAGKTLSTGIPLKPQLVDARTMTLRHDVFRDQKLSDFAPYILKEADYAQDYVYLCRLYSSANLWRRAADRLWWNAVQSDALPAFEILRLNREAWLLNTHSIEVVELKLDSILRNVKEHLQESQFFDAVIREICIMDDEDNVTAYKTLEAEVEVIGKMIDTQLANDKVDSDDSDMLGDRLSLERWVRLCGGSSRAYFLGHDERVTDTFRWGYEDWPKSPSITRDSIVPFGNINYAAEDTSIQLVNAYFPESAIDRLLGGHSCEASEILLSPGALWWRAKLRDDLAKGSPVEIELLDTSQNEVANWDQKIKGTVISVQDTFVAIQDAQTPPNLRFVSLNHLFS
ncbi:hypothetical protein FKW77_009356 [Venturia effusa]|uniref:Uncharacterized protein n=1 Tax=Venturia effusa TaxID=50376 RepID=A0A517L026_9PEZI|nr:hypothetical protein FKW77_009356 [Venturia effusa]